jgi:hypothetical protein
MKAKPIFDQKDMDPNGDNVEMRIWKVPRSQRAPSRLKNSLVYIGEGKRIIG